MTIMSLRGFIECKDKIAFLEEFSLANNRSALNVSSVLDYAILTRDKDVVLYVARSYRLYDDKPRVVEFLQKEGWYL